MLARVRSFTIEGLEAREVAVEVDVNRGLPSFTIVGLADAAVREARDRVRAAILNCGYQFPARRITASMAPGDLRKAGSGLDVALACALLAASGQIPASELGRCALFGELALDGALRRCRGTLAVAQAARAAGIERLVVAREAAAEAMLVEGIAVAPAASLRGAVRILRGGPPDRAAAPAAHEEADERAGEGLDAVSAGREDARDLAGDLADVRGQGHAVRALIIAAAGSHNLLLSGPPGSGKTMLARRMPGILPPLSRAEAIEVTRIRSIAGHVEAERVLPTRRPFRAPHHTATTVGLVGGTGHRWLGEVVLAHNGVLFLDELAEFSRQALEALRQPIEEGRVAIVRAGHAAVYPARFLLLAATNPCACGYAGTVERCACSEAELARYRRKLSGPLLDRIDLVVHMGRDPGAGEDATITSRRAREAVAMAHERRRQRLAERGASADGVRDGAMDASSLRRDARLDRGGEALLARAHERRLLSARGWHRTLRVARTVADLRGSDAVCAEHVALALSLRPQPLSGAFRAA